MTEKTFPYLWSWSEFVNESTGEVRVRLTERDRCESGKRDANVHDFIFSSDEVIETIETKFRGLNRFQAINIIGDADRKVHALEDYLKSELTWREDSLLDGHGSVYLPLIGVAEELALERAFIKATKSVGAYDRFYGGSVFYRKGFNILNWIDGHRA